MFQLGRTSGTCPDGNGCPSPGASPSPGVGRSEYESPGGSGRQTPTRASSFGDSVLGSEAVLSGIEWEGDRDICSICQKKIGKRHMSRRHHCRLCGKCVCSACSPNSVQIDGVSKPQRVCTGCGDSERLAAAQGAAALSERLQALVGRAQGRLSESPSPEATAEPSGGPDLALETPAALDVAQPPETKAALKAETRAAREEARRKRLEDAQLGAAEIDFAQAQAERLRRRSVESEPVGGDNLLYAQPPAALAATPAQAASKTQARSQGESAIEAALGVAQHRIGSSEALNVGPRADMGPSLEMQYAEPEGVSTSFAEPDTEDKSCVRGEACKKACTVQ